ncbi:5-oxoprolinase subunit PxpB [Dokdonella sp.]|uniref:5-oxoprolinase subunit PxpB n=1 Tax=Dokdonella sp. TaxID=2291710 RepID=UPI0031CADDAA|nr:5-oxoprolinase subunit PxpB [Dokdonella sp.]
MAAPGAGTDCSFEPLGESVLLLRFGTGIDTALNARVHAAVAQLRQAGLAGVRELVPAYASLALHYAPAAWSDGQTPAWRRLAGAVRAILATPDVRSTAAPRSIDIPVCYGGAHGPDLDALARQAGLAPSQVIARHLAPDYQVAMLGFAPGFPYLLGLDPALHAPRRADPRVRVPAGSVAIGGAQTGIYPAELPGGWQLIGRTPLRLFDPAREPACLLGAGDRVRFLAIDPATFDRLAAT